MPAGSSLSGDSAHGKNQGAGFCAGRAPPTARRMRARATEPVVDLGRFDNESAWGTAGTERSSSAGGGSMAWVESGAAALLAGAATGVFATGMGPIVAGANAGPGVEVMAVA